MAGSGWGKREEAHRLRGRETDREGGADCGGTETEEGHSLRRRRRKWREGHRLRRGTDCRRGTE